MEQDLLLGEHGGEEREHGAHPQLLEQQRHARPRGRHARVGHVTNLDNAMWRWWGRGVRMCPSAVPAMLVVVCDGGNTE